MTETARARFDAKWVPEPNTGCWLWTGAVSEKGYGAFWGGLDGPRTAHRWAWLLYRGLVPHGMVLDHLCRVRSCVNPDHLRVVTPTQNTLENSVSFSATNRAKTHCKRGHLLEGPALRIRRNGARVCVLCRQRERD